MYMFKRFLNTTLLGVFTFTIGINSSANAAINIPDAPIFIGTNIQPNIMFAVDDSGSMDWEVLLAAGAGVHGGPNSGNLDFSPNDFNEDREMCAGYNVLAYDPNVTYTPWIGEDNTGATFVNQSITNALNEPFRTGNGTRNLLAVDGTGIPTFYANWVDADLDGVYDAGECPIGNNNGAGYTGRAFVDPRFVNVGTLGTTPVAQYTNPLTGISHSAQTNYANWYTYYRKREYVLKRVMSELIADSTARLGLATLWNRNNVGTAIRDMTVAADKEILEDQVFTIDSNNGTPLRALLDNVGKYYDDTDGSGAPAAIGFTEGSPILPGNQGGECQQNFTVLMSDGFWNGFYGGGVGNADGDGNTTIPNLDVNGTLKNVQVDGGPHADNFSNTLADIAMHYYERDLSGLPDNVPVVPIIDEANHQRMITYAVSFGLTGTGLTTPVDHEPGTPPPPWSQPISNTNTTLDDMQHAAFNGRGVFLNAANPQDLITSLSDAIEDIDARNSFSGTSVAVNSTILRTNSRLYTAGFDSDDYTGSLKAFMIDTNGNISPTEEWDAAGGLSSASAATRDIFTIVNKAGIDTPIPFTNADPDLITAVATGNPVPAGDLDGTDGNEIIDYIRGSNVNEMKNSGIYSFRDRDSTILGDIVSSSPVVAGADDFGYDILPGTEGSSYASFLTAKKSTFTGTPANTVVLVGSNDGMLHAINANNSGSESFAYVPKTVHQNLNLLTSPSYGHKFFVNSTGFAGDAYTGGSWETIYVSALGEGGRGIFALNITNPFSTANPAMWERNSADTAIDPGYAEIGYIKHRPVVVRLNNGKWGVIVGNGYNSASEKAQLLILDVTDGSIMARLDTNTGGTGASSPGVTNGLSEPFTLDADGDRIVDYVYAADLLGNIWKFDLTSTSASGWKVSFGSVANPQPFYTAVEPDGVTPQQITVRPTLAVHPLGGFLVLFGTGKYIEPSDNILPTPVFKNTFYGIYDNGSAQVPSGRGTLVEQTVTTSPTNPDARIVSTNPVDYSGGAQGWYMDFIIADGEMIIANPIVRFGNVIFVTYIPSNTPCDFGGTSFIMGLDALSGARTQGNIFDFNNDGVVDTSDNVDGGVGSGIQVKGTVGGLGVVLNQQGQDKILTSKLEGGGLQGTMTAGGNLILGRTSWRQLQ